MLETNHIWKIAQRELLHWVRGREFVGYLLTPTFWLVMFVGPMSNWTQRVHWTGVASGSYVADASAGILAMGVLFSAGPGASCVVADKMLGFLNRLMALPIRRASIGLGYMLQLLVKSVVVCLTLAALAWTMGARMASPVGWVILVLLTTLLATGLAGLSVSLALRVASPGAFFGYTSMFTLPLIFASPAFLNADTLPTWMRVFSRVNPVSAFVVLIRSACLSDLGSLAASVPATSLLGLVAFAGLGLIAAVRSFEKA